MKLILRAADQAHRIDLVMKLEALRMRAIDEHRFEDAMVLRDAKWQIASMEMADTDPRKPWEAALFYAFCQEPDSFLAEWYLDVRVGARAA